MKTKLTAGDTVSIIDRGEQYPYYTEFYDRCRTAECLRLGEAENEDVGEIVLIHKHLTETKKLALVNIPKKNLCCLISLKGLSFIKASAKYVIKVPHNGVACREEIQSNDFLSELQRLVGGYIEILRIGSLGNSMRMVVNEEGKLKDLPCNYKASLLYNVADDYISGDAFIVKTKNSDIEPFTDSEYVDEIIEFISERT